MNDYLNAIGDVLRATRFVWTTEADLQRGIVQALEASGFDVATEVRVDARNRLDLLVERSVGVEVKIAGTWRDVRRQLERYAELDVADAFVLATTRPMHSRIGTEVGGKPLLIHRVGSAL